MMGRKSWTVSRDSRFERTAFATRIFQAQPYGPLNRRKIRMKTFSFFCKAALTALVMACSATALHAESSNANDATGAMNWRLLGPFRAGWSTVAKGVADEPDTFYFGAAGGGVWKTTDAGHTWHPLFDGVAAASVGALAIAPGDAKILYAGTGQVTSRYDIAAGNGVYKSADAGTTWQHAGLDATRYIGSINVDPRNADHVLVAALGHVYADNIERGVFRSIDGGKTWTKTLFVDASTGAVDLTIDPQNPDIVFASVWKVRYWPWLSYFMSEQSTASCIYKSSDAGATWKRITGGGWPTAKMGRIGVAAAHIASGTRIYAVVDSDDAGGLYRSDDGGANWTYVNKRKAFGSGYFSSITVAPNDPDIVYAMGQSIWRCANGGVDCTVFKGAPGGDDYHQLWINPQHPDHLVTASDQGTAVSVNGGKSWSDWYNQPTGQFYHLAADNRFPYWVYSGQQDSGTAGVSSRSNYGALSFRDWNPVGGDERDYDVPDPNDANIVYGSGLGGRLSRWNARTGEVQNVSPWPISSYGQRPTDFKYRYTWITPIAVSPIAPFPLYQGAQVLFRSTDQGSSWQTISPDLSAKSPRTKECEGDLAPAAARDCGFGVIYSIGLSPRDNDEIWIGTDDGLIRRTRDGGAHWDDVTPKLVPAWGKVATVDVSAATPGTVYAAIDTHRQDDFRPHVLRTRDSGHTWAEVVTGLPPHSFVDVVRADPVKSGLLYAGTDLGVFVSFDDGDHWQPLQRNLPPAWVRDLLVHGDDLIAATQGRAIWILDDVTPLRQHEKLQTTSALVLEPAAAIRVRGSQNKDTPPPADTALGQNPPNGATIDYFLPNDVKHVAIEIHDGKGNLVRRVANDDSGMPKAERYFAETWAKAVPKLDTSAGMHRYIWNLRRPRPLAVHYDFSIGAVFAEGTPIVPEGMLVQPGDYDVTLIADGTSSHAILKIVPDPRTPIDADTFDNVDAFARDVVDALKRDYIGYGELHGVDEQLDKIDKTKRDKTFEKFNAAAKSLRSGEGDTSENFDAIGEILSGLMTDIEGNDRAPTRQQREVLAATVERLDRAEKRWAAIKGTEFTALNGHLKATGNAEITVPAPDKIRIDQTPQSKERP
jgi:photosystem II stability/assembly factor-like uncharacterized protein